MYKPKKLLKVISIIILVFAVFAAFSLVMLIGTRESVAELTGIEVTTASLVTSAVAVLLEFVVGIIGLASKNFKLSFITAVIYVAFAVINCIIGLVSAGMNPLSLTGLILPLLYAWGVYQSKE